MPEADARGVASTGLGLRAGTDEAAADARLEAVSSGFFAVEVLVLTLTS